MIKSAYELEHELRTEMRVDQIHRPSDRNVFVPSFMWVQQFGVFLQANKRDYVPQAWDCDDFARWAVGQASEALIKILDVPEAGHAVFYCEVVIQNHDFWGGAITGFGGKHALNLVRTRDRGWWFLEPQNGKLIPYEAGHSDDYLGPIIGVPWVWM